VATIRPDGPGEAERSFRYLDSKIQSISTTVETCRNALPRCRRGDADDEIGEHARAPALWSMAVLCTVAISCWPRVLRTISRPLDRGGDTCGF
jgi:hypothetical protein